MTPRDVATALAVLTFLAAVGGATYLAFGAPADRDPYTSLYLLNESGEASGYPNELAVGEAAIVRVGVVNREGERRRYRVLVTLAGRNVTDYGLRLAHGARDERPVTFSAREPGRHRLRVRVFLPDGGSDPYRRASIRVVVSERNETATSGRIAAPGRSPESISVARGRSTA